MSDTPFFDNLQKFELILRNRISSEFFEDPRVKVSAYESFAENVVSVMVKQSIWGQRLCDPINKKYPKNWKESLKDRFAPKWFLNIFPVEYDEIHIDIAELYPKWSPNTEKLTINLNSHG